MPRRSGRALHRGRLRHRRGRAGASHLARRRPPAGDDAHRAADALRVDPARAASDRPDPRRAGLSRRPAARATGSRADARADAADAATRLCGCPRGGPREVRLHPALRRGLSGPEGVGGGRDRRAPRTGGLAPRRHALRGVPCPDGAAVGMRDDAFPGEPFTQDVTVRRQRYLSTETGFAVLDCTVGGDAVVLVGPLAHLEERERARVAGEWVDDPRYGPQVRVRSATPLAPSDEEALLAYLRRVHHVGARRAQRLLDAYGVGVLDAVDADPGHAL